MSQEKLGKSESIGYIPMPGTTDEPERARRGPVVDQVAPVTPAPVASQPASVERPPAPPEPARMERVRREATRPEPKQAAPNPPVSANRWTWVSPHAAVHGDVRLGEEVFVGPMASVRGDSGAPIFIGDASNVQDGVTVHCDDGATMTVNNQRYAVYLGSRVSLAHRCLIHGPVVINDDVFVGFGAIVMNSTVGRGAMIMHMAYVSGVDIPPGRLVPAGTVVDQPEQARMLPKVGEQQRQFAERVVQANRRYAREYAEGTRR